MLQRILCLNLAAAAALFAADGPVLLNQDSGFPITISQPGSYKLAGNLTVPDADTTAIVITADFVTLDLGGFTISGPVQCSGDPVVCPAAAPGMGINAGGNVKFGPRGVVVRNGSVHGFGGIGIRMSGDATTVENVIVDSNAGGGITVGGSVIKSASTRNGSFGIIATIVRDSNSSSNAGDGIILNPGGIAAGNTSSANGGYGISVPVGTADHNSLFLNKSFGISSLCPSTLTGNTIIASGGNALDLSNSGCVQTDNAIRP